jgi:hypothetical protein
VAGQGLTNALLSAQDAGWRPHTCTNPTRRSVVKAVDHGGSDSAQVGDRDRVRRPVAGEVALVLARRLGAAPPEWLGFPTYPGGEFSGGHHRWSSPCRASTNGVALGSDDLIESVCQLQHLLSRVVEVPHRHPRPPHTPSDHTKPRVTAAGDRSGARTTWRTSSARTRSTWSRSCQRAGTATPRTRPTAVPRGTARR